MTIRCRAAPAPSGELHVGNVRTFLFNWLFTRHVGGTFVLRIEDTDKARFTEAAYEAALRDLEWIGLDWDEGPKKGGGFGPYRQSERLELHAAAAQRLLAEGRAYRCFCTPEELEARRKEAAAEKRKPMYDERCFHLSDAEVAERVSSGSPFAVRFRVPEEGIVAFSDLVVGDVKVDCAEVEDFVILRSDGSPLYHLGVVVDDAMMQITHVIRGDDHLSNTPKQVLLHEALGNIVPVFAHVPQVVGPDRKPFAKRHGSTAVGDFRERGYLPAALFNYLTFLGWGTAEDTILSKDELVERFSIEQVHASAAMFDFDKLTWMNGEYIRMLSDQELEDLLVSWLQRAGLVSEPPTARELELLRLGVPLVKTRIRLLTEAAVMLRPLFGDIDVETGALEKVRKLEGGAEFLNQAIEALRGLDDWRVETVEAALRMVQEQMRLSPRKAFLPLYVGISGSTVSIPVFDSIAIVGKDVAVARLSSLKSLL